MSIFFFFRWFCASTSFIDSALLLILNQLLLEALLSSFT